MIESITPSVSTLEEVFIRTTQQETIAAPPLVEVAQ
jgi:hypothetical protein